MNSFKSQLLIVFKLVFGMVLSFTLTVSALEQTTQLPAGKLVKQTGKTEPSYIKGLLKSGEHFLLKPGAEKNDMDSALHYFNKAIQLSQAPYNIDLLNQGLLLKGDCYMEMNRVTIGKPYFMQVIQYYQKSGFPLKEAVTWSRFGYCIDSHIPADIKLKADCYAQAEKIIKKHLGAPNASDKRNKSDTSVLNLLVQLGDNYLNKPDTQKRDVNQALFYYTKVIEASIQIKDVARENMAKIHKGACYLKNHQFEQALPCFMQAILYYHTHNNVLEEARNWWMLGSRLDCRNRAEWIFSANCYQNAEKIYRSKGQKDKVAEVLYYKGLCHFYGWKLKLAQIDFSDAIKEFKETGYKGEYLDICYAVLADIFKFQGDQTTELYYRLKNITSVALTQNIAYALGFYSQLGLTYTNLKMYDKADHCYRKALSFHAGPDHSSLYHVTELLARNLIFEQRPNEAFDLLKKLKKETPPTKITDKIFMDNGFALFYIDQKKLMVAGGFYADLIKRIDTAYKQKVFVTQDVFVYRIAYVNLLLQLKKYAEAKFYFSGLAKLPLDEVSPFVQSTYEMAGYKIDSVFRDDRSALKHFKKYAQINDSLFNATKTRQVDEMQFKFETEKKDEAILSKSKNIELLTKRAELQRKLVEKTVLIRNLVIGGLCMLLLLLTIGYNRYRLKKRSNMLLQKQRNEIDDQNHSLQELNDKQNALLIEKEWLLREIHHRVKNNLQTSISLLNMQSAHVSNDEALSAIKDSQRRMFSMSLIHQRLYQSDNMTLIDMQIYLKELIVYLKESFNHFEDIRVDVSVDPLNLDVALALPLGLIINEAVTNAIKYAFPDKRKGTIRITLNEKFDKTISLIIEDNGIGFSLDKYNTQTSLGIKLMRGLTEQIQGDFDLQTLAGTSITIKFAANLLVV